MDAFEWCLDHLELDLHGSRGDVEVADEAKHLLIHRHEDGGGEGPLVRVFDRDRLVGLFVVVGYLETDVDDLNDRFVTIEGYRSLHLVVDSFEEDAKEFHWCHGTTEGIVGLADDAVLLICGRVLRDDGGGVGVGEQSRGVVEFEFLEGFGFDLGEA